MDRVSKIEVKKNKEEQERVSARQCKSCDDFGVRYCCNNIGERIGC